MIHRVYEKREVPTLLSIKGRAYFEYATAQAKGEGPTPGPQIQSLLPVNVDATSSDRGIDFPIPGT
jgi:hypothetical protein